MTELTLGTVRYRITAVARAGDWAAHAVRVDTGDRFGIECAGPTEAEAVDRLSRWLDWHNEHAAALEDLQRAERAYYRMIAGSAFVNPTEGPTAVELQKESLEQVEAARVRLDDVRARRPE